MSVWFFVRSFPHKRPEISAVKDGKKMSSTITIKMEFKKKNIRSLQINWYIQTVVSYHNWPTGYKNCQIWLPLVAYSSQEE